MKKRGSSSAGSADHMWIGVEESEKLKAIAICRGLVNGKTKPKSWMAEVVMALRDRYSPEGYDHEAWGARTFVPEWAWRLEEFYGDGWVYYPKSGDDLKPRSLGVRYGFQSTLSDRSIEMLRKEPKLLESCMDEEDDNDGFDKRKRRKVPITLVGFDSLESMIEESYKAARDFRHNIFAKVSANANAEELTQFTTGFSQGATEAMKIDFNNPEFLERKAVVAILLEHSTTIDALPNRTEINKFILAHLPRSKAASLGKEEQWVAFADRMRDIYERIELKKARRGRPRKNREIEEI